MMGQRILALVTDAFGGYGGIAQYNKDLLSAFAQISDVERIDVLPRHRAEEVGTTISPIQQHAARKNRTAYAISAIALALKHRPTIVFSGHLYHGPLAEAIAWLSGARLICQLHGTEIWRKISAAQRRTLERSDLVLAVSRDTRAKVLSRVDIEPEKVVVLSNTVGRDFTPGDRHAARALWGLTEDFAILTVARLDAREGYKGHDRIIPLLPRLRSEGVRVTYLIAGTGDDKERLMALAASSGVGAYVRFLGKVPREDLPDLYRASDLFALPSTGEGFGIAYLEAMACGTRAIGLRVGGAPDPLADGELGACVTADAFYDALNQELQPTGLSFKGLSESVRSRFGLAVFRARVAEILAR